jgi:hypothetical protein
MDSKVGPSVFCQKKQEKYGYFVIQNKKRKLVKKKDNGSRKSKKGNNVF